ncbi:MAG: hypothetical protein QGG54_11500 [Gammaproteobacteria bacterium]|nr:hypothetical protein [Rhodospirillaceae bacterium]MDP6415630.1 hypothetical protein [Gammaproteobacteria bacterium]
MRINARLDSESESYLEKIKQIKWISSTIDALKYSLKEAASHLEQADKPGDKLRGLLKSSHVGQFDAQ